jgi:hypothetical protein
MKFNDERRRKLTLTDKMSDKDRIEQRRTKMDAIFKNECTKKNIEYKIVTVNKIEPKTQEVLWEANVAIPTSSDGFKALLGEERTVAFLSDKLKIWLRSQNDPRRVASSTVTINGEKFEKSEIAEFLRWKASQVEK